MTDRLPSGELWAPSQAQVASSLHRQGPTWALVPSRRPPPAQGPRERSRLRRFPGSQLDTQQQGCHGSVMLGCWAVPSHKEQSGGLSSGGGGRTCVRRRVHPAESDHRSLDGMGETSALTTRGDMSWAGHSRLTGSHADGRPGPTLEAWREVMAENAGSLGSPNPPPIPSSRRVGRPWRGAGLSETALQHEPAPVSGSRRCF